MCEQEGGGGINSNLTLGKKTVSIVAKEIIAAESLD